MLLVAACGDVTAPTLSLGGDADEDEENGDDQDATAPDEPTQGELEVHFLDVGQADATLLRHDEVTVLIDTGHWQRSDVIDHLDDLGVEQLDLVVVTHPHADHVGQFDQVLETYDVDEVWWSGSETTTQTFERALDALEASDAAYEEPRAGDTTTLGPLEVEVVNPPEDVDLGDLHDANLAMRITFGELRLLFTGDAEAATEERMVEQAGGTLAADVLQLGHHGSDTSTTPDLLDAVDPEVAVYSAGTDNTYGHPHAEVLDRLDAAGVTVHGTPEDGTVVVTSDGSSWSVSTEHDGGR
jgi:competence protein ComEC